MGPGVTVPLGDWALDDSADPDDPRPVVRIADAERKQKVADAAAQEEDAERFRNVAGSCLAELEIVHDRQWLEEVKSRSDAQLLTKAISKLKFDCEPDADAKARGKEPELCGELDAWASGAGSLPPNLTPAVRVKLEEQLAAKRGERVPAPFREALDKLRRQLSVVKLQGSSRLGSSIIPTCKKQFKNAIETATNLEAQVKSADESERQGLRVRIALSTARGAPAPHPDGDDLSSTGVAISVAAASSGPWIGVGLRVRRDRTRAREGGGGGGGLSRSGRCLSGLCAI